MVAFIVLLGIIFGGVKLLAVANNISDIALNELYNEQVIINTTKKSTYVVNHNYIFRGSMTDFIKIYHDKYDGMVGFLDDKKRIILDD